MNFVWSVREPKRARVDPKLGEWKVLRYSAASVDLDRTVDHGKRHLRDYGLDHRDLLPCSFVANRVHHPRSLEHEESRLLDGQPRVGDPLTDDTLFGYGLSKGDARSCSFAHQLEGSFRDSYQTHAVMHTARTEPALCD